ncbi:MAG TPA: hypothetical protein VM261_10760 [Kofleriaceae bacterium]|nr:hypothetical protein [Kofleriaceae bacterium]
MALARFLRPPLASIVGFAVALGLALSATPAEAQLWKPSKKKPATAIKAKSKPAPRKVGKPTKRKPKSSRLRKKAPPAETRTVVNDDVDDAPIITIYPGDDED